MVMMFNLSRTLGGRFCLFNEYMIFKKRLQPKVAINQQIFCCIFVFYNHELQYGEDFKIKI